MAIRLPPRVLLWASALLAVANAGGAVVAFQQDERVHAAVHVVLTMVFLVLSLVGARRVSPR